MGQLVLIDEDELDELKHKVSYCDLYTDALEGAQERFYPNFISTNPVNKYGYLYEILLKMQFELLWKRKPWYKKIF